MFIEFSDANAKFYCRLYYAGEFHKMREVILDSSEEDFIRSLSHSSPWQARGGKSGAAFYATEGEPFSLFIDWFSSLHLFPSENAAGRILLNKNFHNYDLLDLTEVFIKFCLVVLKSRSSRTELRCVIDKSRGYLTT